MIPRKLLAQLAPEWPNNQDEQGGCVHCGGAPPGNLYGYAGRDLADHERGCPWVKARRMLGDKLPDSRKPPNPEANRPEPRERSA